MEAVLACEKAVRAIVRTHSAPKLRFNEDKRGIYTTGQRRMVTGLVITPDQRVSLGRERKRLISVMLHKVKLGERSSDHVLRLKGYLGFAIAAEADFVTRLRTKYGRAVVDFVLRFKTDK